MSITTIKNIVHTYLWNKGIAPASNPYALEILGKTMKYAERNMMFSIDRLRLQELWKGDQT